MATHRTPRSWLAAALVLGLAGCNPRSAGERAQGGEAETAPGSASKKGPEMDLAKVPWARLRGVKPIELTPDTARWRRLGVKSAHAFLGEKPDVLLVVYEFADQPALLAAKDELVAVAPPPDALQVQKPPGF